MRYKTEQGITFYCDGDEFGYSAPEKLYKEIQRADVYIRGMHIKLTEKDKQKLRDILK